MIEDGEISPRFAMANLGGEGGSRTHGRVTPTPVFETGTLGHSVTSPSELAGAASHYRGSWRAEKPHQLSGAFLHILAQISKKRLQEFLAFLFQCPTNDFYSVI